MQPELTQIDDVVSLLRSRGYLRPEEGVRPLAGGVSALVAVVEGGVEPWLVKTPLSQLRVSDQWLAGRERGANEAAILSVLGGALGPVRIPRLRFFDEESVVLGEEFIPPPALNYKEELLAGRAHREAATQLGQGLAHLHRLSVPGSLRGPGPRRLFDALRLDPYYRTTAERRVELRADLTRLVEETIAVGTPTLVHGDLSPKNVLLTPSAPVLLDWEVVHEGDPSFDRGMMGAHFMLKAILHQARTRTHAVVQAAEGFWRSYDGPAPLDMSIRHAGGVMLARLFGKSPVDYLEDEDSRDRARRIGARALSGDVRDIEAFLALIEEE